MKPQVTSKQLWEYIEESQEFSSGVCFFSINERNKWIHGGMDEQSTSGINLCDLWHIDKTTEGSI